jgi:flagellar hook-basal body complex protein FliE
MDPLAALSALTSGSGSVQLPLTATTPSMPGAPVGESFQLPGVDQLGLLPSMGGAAPATSAVAPAASGGGPSTWGHMVQQMVMDANTKQHTAAEQVSDVLRGGPTPIHQAMISTEEAGLSFEFLNEMRNKLVDAYQQVMQMQV